MSGEAKTRPDYSALLQDIGHEYPAIGRHAFVVRDGTGPGFSEFYAPQERDNPQPGAPVIEIQEKGRALSGDALRNLLAGEALHYLGVVDPAYQTLARHFLTLRTPKQIQLDQRAYRQQKAEFGDRVSTYDDWLTHSRQDAYIRGYLFPSGGDDWRANRFYTPEQEAALRTLQEYLRRGEASP